MVSFKVLLYSLILDRVKFHFNTFHFVSKVKFIISELKKVKTNYFLHLLFQQLDYKLTLLKFKLIQFLIKTTHYININMRSLT